MSEENSFCDYFYDSLTCRKYYQKCVSECTNNSNKDECMINCMRKYTPLASFYSPKIKPLEPSKRLISFINSTGSPGTRIGSVVIGYNDKVGIPFD